LKKTIYKIIQQKKASHKKMVAVLIDPDKAKTKYLVSLCAKAKKAKVDFILIGGSLMTDGDIQRTVKLVKQQCTIPTILFPGSAMQITNAADGILFLSLLSSRNPEMLIGQQVVAAPNLMKTKLEVISTAYLLIDSGVQTTASYMSNSNPIPAD
jgi:putative glycerol-1-phosphate prenyltransferase